MVRRISGGSTTTIAGNGTQGYSGDGGSSTNAALSNPTALLVDSTGNLFIGDASSIRLVANGIITTLAGSSLAGYYGDGQPPSSALVNGVTGLALDANRNLYIADSGNQRVRKIVSGQIITTAGNGTPGYSVEAGPALGSQVAPYGLVVDAAGNVIVSDSADQRIRQISNGTIFTLAGDGLSGFAGDGQIPTAARFANPKGIAIDAAGNLYIADTGNNVVREISGGVISTVAGNTLAASTGDGGSALIESLLAPTAIAVDGAGNLYIAEQSRIRKVSGGIITTVAGGNLGGYSGDGGLALAARLQTPGGLAVDGNGTLYIADTGNCMIRKVSGGVISLVAGNGSSVASGDGGAAVAAGVRATGITVDGSGNIYAADRPNNRVRLISGGVITTLAGTGAPGFSGDNGTAGSAQLAQPIAVALDAAGNLFVADSGADHGDGRIRMIVLTTAQLVSPQPGSTLAGASVAFTWNAASGADSYRLDVGSAAGQNDLASGTTSATSLTLNGLPCDGRTLYVQLLTRVAGTYLSPQQYSFTAASNCSLIAQMTSPTPGSTLADSTVSFAWTVATAADNYWLDVGNTIGQGDISAGATTATSKTVGGLPCDGRTLYVQLWSHVASGWQTPQQYTYKACGGGLARITAPVAGSILGSSATFTWNPTVSADQYWLDVGNSLAQGDISAGATTATSVTVNGLPCDGRTIFVQLWTHLNGVWQTPQRYTYQAGTGCVASVSQISSPAPGSTLKSTNVTFAWSAIPGADNYWLDVGNSVAQGDISAGATTVTARSVGPLPCDGRTIYVQVWTHLNGAWQTPQRYTYMAASNCVTQAQLITPAPNSALTQSYASFTWTGVAGATAYWLDVGTAPAQGNLFGQNTGNLTTVFLTGLPTDGRILYVQVWTQLSGVWYVNQYTVTAAH